MSSQDIRNEIIRENMPKLLKALTGFQDDNKNLRRCEQFAWSIVRHRRNVSTNSHEVRRRIEGMQEKFSVENFPEYASHLGRLCDEVAQHPLCVKHYEVDVHWSLLDLLLSLAYNPAGALRRNKDKIDIILQAEPMQDDKLIVQNEEEYWKNALQEDFIPLSSRSDSTSDLSDWSDDAEDVRSHFDALILPKEEIISIKKPPLTDLTNIRPPEKQLPFKVYDGSCSEKHLVHTVQTAWWQTSSRDELPHSARMDANFATNYVSFLNNISGNMIRFEKPSITSELCLLRELVWMFNKPVSCKFFVVEGNDIKVRPHVSVPSVSANGLKHFLEQHLIPPIKMMHTLRQFYDSVYKCEDFTPPMTVETYAANLSTLLTPITQRLLDYEARLIAQRDRDITTLINFHGEMRGTFELLGRIYALHQQVVLDMRLLPEHIVSVYLLARLMHSDRMATSATESNLAISLFLTSVKVFCAIIDKWWTEGRLEDYQKEFLVERVSTTDENVHVRLFEKNKEKGVFVPTAVSKVIKENNFFRLLLEHTLEAGSTLNMLYEAKRITDLRNASNDIKDQLYDVFLDDVMQQIRLYQSQVAAAVPPEDSGNANKTTDVFDAATSEAPSSNYDLLSSLSTKDEFLRLAFAGHCNLADDHDATDAAANDSSNCDALSIFKQFEQTQHKLPFQEIILSSLTRILRTRIAFANSFVIRLYREDYQLQTHLHNLRTVLLLESSDLMQHFYNEVFHEIEAGNSWSNPIQLTMLLNDIICAKYPQMSSLFRVEINSTHRCDTRKVVDAVDELVITYNASSELAHIITPDAMMGYNKVFCFLLKVKWALVTIEELRFPLSHKRHIIYAPTHMSDFLMRRLEQLRFWMYYAIQNIHFHLMTHVLHSMGEQLDEQIANCANLKDLQTVHKSYISILLSQCFLVEEFSSIMVGIEQLLNLTYIMRMEWISCVKFIEQDNPLALASSDTSDGTDSEDIDTCYVANSQVDAIEVTYIRCHQFLANRLNNELYLKNHTFLSGLSSAFNTCMPH